MIVANGMIPISSVFIEKDWEHHQDLRCSYRHEIMHAFEEMDHLNTRRKRFKHVDVLNCILDVEYTEVDNNGCD